MASSPRNVCLVESLPAGEGEGKGAGLTLAMTLERGEGRIFLPFTFAGLRTRGVWHSRRAAAEEKCSIRVEIRAADG